MAIEMEQNIQDSDTNSESDTVRETENSDSTERKFEKRNENTQNERSIEIEMQTILKKIKELPSQTEELEEPVPTKDSEVVYAKLCKVLKVRELSAFITQLAGEKMDLSYQCLGPVGIIPVTKALASSKSVKILDLKYNRLGLKGLPPIISMIEQNENILHLNLAANEIGKGSASLLNELVSRCFTVEFLNLSNNNLGDEELQEIGLAIMKADSVKELFLNSNDFSSAKAQPFGSSINKCSVLMKLDISSCHLEEGAMYIFGGLKMSNLTVLNLARNGIPNEAMPALATGLRGNKSLKEIDLSYNIISNKGAVALAPGLKSSSTLEVMILAHNPIQGSAATKILNSAGDSLKLLDLTAIKVNMDFFRTLRKYAKADRELRVLFGSEIRYDLFPRDLSAPDAESISKDNVITYLEKIAEEKSISLRNALKSIHANFIAEQFTKLAAEKEKGAAEKKDKKEKGAAEKKDKKEKDPTKKTDAKEKDAAEQKDVDKRPEMTTEEFAKALANSAIGVPKTKIREVTEALSEEEHVNMWKLITKIRWKPDDLNVKIKAPKKVETGDKKKDKKKKK